MNTNINTSKIPNWVSTLLVLAIAAAMLFILSKVILHETGYGTSSKSNYTSGAY